MKLIIATTPTCVKCKSLHHIINSLDEGTVDAKFINILDESDESKSLLEEFGIKQVPYLIFYNSEGKVVETMSGSVSKSDILKIINNYKEE